MDGGKYGAVMEEKMLGVCKSHETAVEVHFSADPKRKAQLQNKTWPSQSPDLNALENLTEQEEWVNISVSRCVKLVEMCPERLTVVTAAKGGSTRVGAKYILHSVLFNFIFVCIIIVCVCIYIYIIVCIIFFVYALLDSCCFFVYYLYMCASSSVTFISVSVVFVSVHSQYLSTDTQKIVGGVLVGTSLWVTIIMIMRNVLKSLLSWHGWMYERHGSISWTSRAWMVRWEICTFESRFVQEVFKFEGHLYSDCLKLLVYPHLICESVDSLLK